MTFRELFWAHLVHNEMKWPHITFLVSVSGFGVAMVFFAKELPLGFMMAGLGLLFALTYQHPLFYALAKVPIDEEKPGEAYFWYASWLVYLGQQVMLLFVVTGYLHQANNAYWANLWWFVVPFYAFWNVRRFFKLKNSPKSHFRGHEHHSSKTVR